MEFKRTVNTVNKREAIRVVLAMGRAISVIGHLQNPGQSVVSGLSLLTHE